MNAGTVIDGKFRVERVLGRGGMGVVVVATHLRLDREVALKFLHDDVEWDATAIERFAREARASAMLETEHVCRVLDVGQLESGLPYIVMELLEGRDLAALIRDGALAPPKAAAYVLQACVAIAEAHAHGIVHRDLKPSNLFLTERLDGTPLVKVLDFGIAKAPGKLEAQLTRTTATVMGSPGYMSPEQLRSAKNVDARTDIWSLGVVLYEAVAGHLPFRADTITELAVKVAVDDFEPLEVEPAYRAVVTKCLQKSAAQRYQSVAELAAALAPIAGAAAEASAAAIARLADSSAKPAPSVDSARVVEDATIRDEAPPTMNEATRRSEPIAAIAETRRSEPIATVAPNRTQLEEAPKPVEPRPRRRTFVLGIAGVIAAGGIVGGLLAFGDSATSTVPAAKLAAPAIDAAQIVATPAPTTHVRLRVRRAIPASAPLRLSFGANDEHAATSLRVLPVQLAIAFQGTARFAGRDDIHRAFSKMLDALPTTDGIGYVAEARLFAIDERATQLYRGRFANLGSSHLARREIYAKVTRYEPVDGLSSIVEQLGASTAEHRTILLLFTRGGSWPDDAVARVAKLLADRHVELFAVPLEDGPDELQSLVDLAGIDNILGTLSPKDAMSFVGMLDPQFEGTSVIDAVVDERAWRESKTAVLDTGDGGKRIDTGGGLSVRVD